MCRGLEKGDEKPSQKGTPMRSEEVCRYPRKILTRKKKERRVLGGGLRGWSICKRGKAILAKPPQRKAVRILSRLRTSWSRKKRKGGGPSPSMPKAMGSANGDMG